ncbi:ATP-binding protein [Helicobacter pametensis]|uniref:ATP-binding protein n=1 Tax=Helicobacter pametensis TaxID=95149 RepID=UPI000480C3AB|nr:ATP-binding protein [Helicobacter pametensis]
MSKNPNITDYEIGIIKALIDIEIPNQEILGCINHYRGNIKNHINSGRIPDIKQGRIGKEIMALSEREARDFLERYSTFELKADGLESLLSHTNLTLHIKENEKIEFKKSFHGFKNWDKVLKPIQGMANNCGGYIFFGIEEKDEINKDHEGGKILGLEEKQVNYFNVDSREISNHLNSYFQEEIKIERFEREIEGKTICVLRVYESDNKPIINKNGEIFYRYNGQVAKIQKLDLVRILRQQQEKNVMLTLNKHLETILKNGVENSAILNIQTGDVSGKSGNFLIEKELLKDIHFIKEGHFVEKNGAPALILRGEIKPIDNIGTVTSVHIPKSINETEIYRCFFNQDEISPQEAKEYLKTLSESQMYWLPIRYFMKKANLSLEETLIFFETLKQETQKSKNVEKKISNLQKNDPQKENNCLFLDQIKNQAKLTTFIKKDSDIEKIARSILSLEPQDFEVSYIIQEVKSLYDFCRENEKKTQISIVRKAIAYIDKILFDQRLMEKEVKNQMEHYSKVEKSKNIP